MVMQTTLGSSYTTMISSIHSSTGSLFGEDFNRFIVAKYGSISSAQSTVKNYYQILKKEFVRNDGTRVPAREVVVDLTSFNSLSTTDRRSETQYDFEVEKNEERKQIKLLSLVSYHKQLMK